MILNSQGAIWRDVREFDRHKQNQPKKPLEVIWDTPGPNRKAQENQDAEDGENQASGGSS